MYWPCRFLMKMLGQGRKNVFRDKEKLPSLLNKTNAKQQIGQIFPMTSLNLNTCLNLVTGNFYESTSFSVQELGVWYSFRLNKFSTNQI